jgi:hypothetical protein
MADAVRDADDREQGGEERPEADQNETPIRQARAQGWAE